MTLGIVVTVRNAMLNAIRNAIDAGAGPGTIRGYDGTRPATGGAATTLLFEVTCSDPSAPDAAGGVLTFSAITSDASANASGNATWCRFVDSTGAFVQDGSVGTSAADLILNTVVVTAGIEVSCTAATITAGNP